MQAETTLLLTAADVEALLGLDDCIAAVEAAFRLLGEGKVAPPGSLGIHAASGGFHVKAGVLSRERSYFAAKVNANFPENRVRYGLPTIQGVLVLCDAENGKRLAVMDSVVITALRTGAATAIAAKYLAKEDASSVTVCGCGTQGRIQLRSLARVRQVKRVFAYDIDQEQAAAFAQQMQDCLRIPITVVQDAMMGTKQSEICITCTTARQPIVHHTDIYPGTFVAAVGADNPEKQELHPSLFRSSKKVVVDLMAQCRTMGDLHHALEAGVTSEQEVHAELAEIVAGTKPGRESEDEIIIFDSTGLAIQDVAAAAVVYENAMEQGRGFELDFRRHPATTVREHKCSSTTAI